MKDNCADCNQFWPPVFGDMENFACFIDKSMTPFAVNDLDGKLLYANASCLKMWGYAFGKEVVGMPIVKFWKGEEKNVEIVDAYIKKKGWTGELTAKRKDGTTFDCHVATNVVADNSGRPHYIASSFTDVTARNYMAKALNESEEKYRALVECSQEGIGFVDPDENITFVNQAFAKMLGYKVNELIGKNLKELTGAGEFKKYREETKKRMRGEKGRYETFLCHKDGSSRFVNVSAAPLMDHNGNFNGTLGVITDITEKKEVVLERKKTAKLLEFYREYAENIVGHLPVSLIVVNRNLRINFANQHFLSKMRLTKEDVIEKKLAEVLGNSIVEGSVLDKKIMRIIKREEERIEDRLIFRRKTYNYMIVPIKEQTGRRMNALLVMEDVTKNVMMEEQLIHSEKLSAVGTFTASVAHEINNPLSIVVGNIQYLLANLRHMNLTKKKDVGEIVETLKTANSEAKRCSEIVTNLLHFSHKGASAKTKVSVNGVVTGTMRLLAHQLELTKIKTHVKLADNLPPVMGNADHLQQAFVNLILNAQQVMKEGGRLYVTTSLADNYVTISFRDTGPGIPKRQIHRIFEPFYSTKEAGKGTGLGLFIIHSIMEEHKGKVEIQSKRGQGAVFILKLPAFR